MIFVFTHGGPGILFVIAIACILCVGHSSACARSHRLVLVWTYIQLVGEVGVRSWVLRAVTCASVLGHQSGLCPDLNPDLHLLLPWRSFVLWCMVDLVLY